MSTATKAKARRQSGPSRETSATASVAQSRPTGSAEELRARVQKLRDKLEGLGRWQPAYEKTTADLAEAERELALAEVRELPMPAALASGNGAAAQIETRPIPVASIDVTGNHREQDDEADTLRLARQIRLEGLLHPIGVRDVGNGRYELIYGSRRTKAVTANGDREILAKVYPASMTAADVELLRTGENFGRKDLTPVEKALAVARTLEAIEKTLAGGEAFIGGEDHGSAAHARADEEAAKLHAEIQAAGGVYEYVGRQLGWSARWVKDNAYVSRLGGKARELLAAHRIDVGHARELARLGDKEQTDEIAENVARSENGLGGRSVEDCRKYVVERMRSLKVVPWRLDVAFGKGRPGCTGQACATCQFNSKSDADLFGGVIADEPEAGICTNESCFRAKQEITQKDVERSVAQAVRRAAKDEAFRPTESFMQQIVPIHVKPATAARKAQKEIKPPEPKDLSANGTRGPGSGIKASQLTPEQKAKEKHEDALQKWYEAVQTAVQDAILGDPRRFMAAAVARFLPAFVSMWDVREEVVTEQADAIAKIVACDVDGLAMLAAKLQAKEQGWKRNVPLFDGDASEELAEALAVGWGVKTKPKPVLEDFLPKPKEPKAPKAPKAEKKAVLPPAPAEAPAYKIGDRVSFVDRAGTVIATRSDKPGEVHVRYEDPKAKPKSQWLDAAVLTPLPRDPAAAEADEFEDPDTGNAPAAIRTHVNTKVEQAFRSFAWRVWNYHTRPLGGGTRPARPLDMGLMDEMHLRDTLEQLAKDEGLPWDSRRDGGSEGEGKAKGGRTGARR